MDKQKISIIISTYNNKTGLSDILKSLWSYNDFEIIIVNHCGEKVDDVKDEFLNLKISIIDMLSPLNKVHGINKALAYSNGEYIIILDDNELVCHEYFAKILSYVGKYDIIFPSNKRNIYGVLYKKAIHQKLGLFSVNQDEWEVHFFELLLSIYKIYYD